MKNNLFIFFLFAAFFFISAFIYKSLLGSGVIALGDFTAAKSAENWVSSNYLYLWNENGYSNLGHLSQLFIFLPLLFFSKIAIISAPHWRFFYFVLLSALSGISVFFLARYLLGGAIKLGKGGLLIISASSFFYIFSTFVVEEVSHQTIKYAFYLAPLMLFALIKGINENKKSCLLFSVILWSLMISAMHWVIFGSIVFLGYIIYDSIYRERNILKIIKKISANCLFVFGFFILLNLYWILPLKLSGGDSSVGNVITRDWGLFWGGVSDMMAAKGIYDPDITYGKLPQFLSFFNDINLNIFLIILTIVGLSSFIFIRKSIKDHLFFGLLFVSAVFLSAGPRFAPELFNWVMLETPFSQYYRGAFRTPRFNQFLIIALAPLIAITGVTIYEFLKTKNKKISAVFPFIFFIIVAAFSIIPNYPLLTGDFNGRLKTVKIPDDYQKTIEYLKEDSSDYRVLWGPQYLGSKSSWHSAEIGSFADQISPKLNRALEEGVLFPLVFGYRLGYEPMFYNGKIKKINDFLSPLNVKYLVVNNDIPWLKGKTDDTLSYLKKQDKLELKKEFGFISIFEVKNPAQQIRAVPVNIDIFGGLEKHNSLTYLDQFNPEAGIIYAEQKDAYKTLNTPGILVTGSDLRALNIIKARRIELAPSSYADDYRPNKVWSKLESNSATFKANLDKRNLLGYYQFDYGKGLVFTSAKDSLNIPFNVKKGGNYKLFARYLKSRLGEEMAIHLNGKSARIETKDDRLNGFIWEDLGEFDLASGSHQIRLENVSGFNAVNLFSLISEQDYQQAAEEAEKDLRDKTIIYILEAETDLFRNGILGVKDDLNASNGRLAGLARDAVAWQNIEIIKNGTYGIALRGIGDFEVKAGDKTFELKSDNLDFAYSPFFDLAKGDCLLEIKSLSDGARLDAVWLYSTENNKNLEQFFNAGGKTAEINYKKINPAFWKTSVKNEKPFMLSFAESYDSLWEAVIYKDGKLVERIKAVPLYGIINGFWIDKTGDLEIEIKFKPQYWFEIGILPSGLVFLGCVGYIVWTCRKKTKKIEFAAKTIKIGAKTKANPP